MNHGRLWELLCTLWCVALDGGCKFGESWVNSTLASLTERLDASCEAGRWPTAPEGMELLRCQKRHCTFDPVLCTHCVAWQLVLRRGAGVLLGWPGLATWTLMGM